MASKSTNRDDERPGNMSIVSFRMHRVLALSAIISVYCLFTFVPAAATLQSLQTGMEAPDFSLKTLDGGSRTFGDVKGEKLTVLVFWSTWSAKSEKLLTRMQQLHENFTGQGLAIVGVNVDEQQTSAETVTGIRTVVEKLKIGFPMLVDQGLTAFHDYGVIAVPTTVVLDKDRNIRQELAGYPLVGSEALIDSIQASIAGKSAPVAEAKPAYQPNKNAVRFYNMGKTTLKSRRMADMAETWFKKAIEADPGFVLPHLSLGKIYLERGDVSLAEKEFRESLAHEQMNPIALCELGMILVQKGKTEEGAALFETARKADEAYPPCYYYAGYAYAKKGALDQAQQMFDEAEKANPFDYHTFVYQGMVYEELKDTQKAFAAYKKALEIVLRLRGSS